MHEVRIEIQILCIGLLVLASYFIGKLTRHLKIGETTGQIIGGLLVGPYFLSLAGILPEASEFSGSYREAFGTFHFFTFVFLGLVAFGIGEELHVDRLKAVGFKAVLICAVQAVITFVLTTTTFLFLGYEPLYALLIGSIGIATAPATTFVIMNKLALEGKMRDMLANIVVLADIIEVLVFSIIMQFAWLQKRGGEPGGAGAALLPAFKDIGLALGIGIAIFLALKFIIRDRGGVIATPSRPRLYTGFDFLDNIFRETPTPSIEVLLIIVGFIAVGVGLGMSLHLPFLITAVVAGFCIANFHNPVLFDSLKIWVNQKYPHYKIFDTICDSTERRQAEVKRLASSVDAIIVVGGRNSGNTQRLFEIAQQTGKPAYHIETEKDLEALDTEALAAAQHIGITAGASTPNWIIKRVYRALEALPYKKGHDWRKAFFTIQRVLLLTNLYVSLGAGCLSYACSKLMGINKYFPLVIIAILYVQSMHIFNHLTGNKADQYNDPDRASFYDKHKLFLSILAFIAGGLGLIIAYTVGKIPFAILLAMSTLGLSYNIPIAPERLAFMRYRRIRDLPGSKTLLIAMAWGIVTTVFPSLSISEKINLSTVMVFMWCTGMVFVRTAFFDILDMQGDRIVGKETIPILLGEKRTMRLLKTILAITLANILLSSALGLISSLGFVLSICPIFLFLVLRIYEKGHLIPGIRLEFLVESLFVLAGSITLVWSVLPIRL